MSVHEALIQRASQPKLTTPAPSADQVNRWLQAALNAPDHGRLKPWRYWIIEDSGLTQLGEVLANAGAALNPDASDAQLDRFRALPLRAPMIIVAAAKITLNHKVVPPWEQLCAVAAGVQSMQLAIQADGMGCMWRTGDMANHAVVKQAFGLAETDQVVGFLYVGTPEASPKPREPVTVEAPYVQPWAKPASS